MNDEIPNPMTRFIRLGCGLLLGALLWNALAPLAPAQEVRTLTIDDSTVYVDGRQLTASQVPGDLDLTGITARYQFVGIERPVIELNGRLFAVENGLTPVSEEEVNAEKSSVILQEIEARPPARSPQSQSTSAQTLEAHRQYLSEVQKANRELYERLVRERTMEQQAQGLARVIRMLPKGSDNRRAKVDSLRALLNDIFDLKQENRLREIERLQRQIQELQRSLQKRKRMREAMIDHRLNQLLGTTTGR
jgi:hypothetical protein